MGDTDIKVEHICILESDDKDNCYSCDYHNSEAHDEAPALVHLQSPPGPPGPPGPATATATAPAIGGPWLMQLMMSSPIVMMLLTVLSRLLFVADITTDVFVAVELQQSDSDHHTSREAAAAALVIVFIILPYIAMWFILFPAVARSSWFKVEWDLDQSDDVCLDKFGIVQFLVVWIVFGLPILACGDVLVLTLYLWRDLPTTSDPIFVTYTRQRAVVGALLQSVPQACLQFYILFIGSGFDVDENFALRLCLGISICCSLASIAKAFTIVYVGSRKTSIPVWNYCKLVVLGSSADKRVFAVEAAVCQIRQGATKLHVGSHIGYTGTRVIANILVESSVTSLHIHGNSIGDLRLQAIADVLAQSSLTSLHLAYNSIGDVGAQSIADVLAQSSLTSLDLRNNSIGDLGAQAIVGALAQSSLTSLDLRCNSIGDVGAQAIAGALSQSSLTSLHLGTNRIGALGAQSIGGALAQSSLTSLYLGNNSIGDLGAQAIGGALTQSSLMELHLHSNLIGDLGAQAIADILVSSGLESLNLWDNPISSSVKQQLHDAKTEIPYQFRLTMH
jgi:Leucine-rich repeat (LRR) protein